MTRTGRAGVAVVAILALGAGIVLTLRRTGGGAAQEAVGPDAADPPGVPARSPGGSDPAEVTATTPESPGLELPPLAPKDDAEAREVVRFARDADLRQLASLERMLAVEEPLVVGNAVRALGRLGLFTSGSRYVHLLDGEAIAVTLAVPLHEPVGVGRLSQRTAAFDAGFLHAFQFNRVGHVQRVVEIHTYRKVHAAARYYFEELERPAIGGPGQRLIRVYNAVEVDDLQRPRDGR